MNDDIEIIIPNYEAVAAALAIPVDVLIFDLENCSFGPRI
jgi:hypothetical protein